MHAHFNGNHCIGRSSADGNCTCGNARAEYHAPSTRCITIGLVNNMPDGALQTTERQFLALLNSASEGIEIRLVLYSLPGIFRKGMAARHVEEFYSSTETLGNSHLDGLIVTGREPLKADLSHELYWDNLASLVDWARENTYSTIWSCLAAHAALLHLDGIYRSKSNHKQFGIFECARLLNHPLMVDAPSRFELPHSRWNGVPEDTLTRCGYSVLTRAIGAGVDTFVRCYNSLFVFFQGHPEYEWDTLMLEYRRDVGRYLRGEIAIYPPMPRSYFDHGTGMALTKLKNEAAMCRSGKLMAEVSTALEKVKIESTWKATATCIYKNWLRYICRQKELAMSAGKPTAAAHQTSEPRVAVATAVATGLAGCNRSGQRSHILVDIASAVRAR
jgi:homoserine O-succinyltransferase/O-acetyltransferase